jgi:serine/threonine protein kinase
MNDFLKEQVYERSSEWIINFEDLKFEEMIATGSTCNVYKGTFKNIPVAIKKLKSVNPSAKFKYMKEFKREVGLLLSMPKHPNMVFLYGFCELNNEIYLVFEYCEGNTLFDILYRRDTRLKLNLQQKLKILMDICRGMQFLHEMSPQMIHRDLKTLNILLDVPIEKGSLNFTAKLADFGLTRVYEANTEFLTKRMGTFHWMAPEVFANKPYSTKSDMYGFAIMMWEVFSEKTPYYHLDDASEVIRFVFYKGGRPKVSDCKIHKQYVNLLTNLMKRNWEEEPENRQEFKDLYNSLNKLFEEL